MSSLSLIRAKRAIASLQDLWGMVESSEDLLGSDPSELGSWLDVFCQDFAVWRARPDSATGFRWESEKDAVLWASAKVSAFEDKEKYAELEGWAAEYATATPMETSSNAAEPSSALAEKEAEASSAPPNAEKDDEVLIADDSGLVGGLDKSVTVEKKSTKKGSGKKAGKAKAVEKEESAMVEEEEGEKKKKKTDRPRPRPRRSRPVVVSADESEIVVEESPAQKEIEELAQSPAKRKRAIDSDEGRSAKQAREGLPPLNEPSCTECVRQKRDCLLRLAKNRLGSCWPCHFSKIKCSVTPVDTEVKGRGKGKAKVGVRDDEGGVVEGQDLDFEKGTEAEELATMGSHVFSPVSARLVAGPSTSQQPPSPIAETLPPKTTAVKYRDLGVPSYVVRSTVPTPNETLRELEEQRAIYVQHRNLLAPLLRMHESKCRIAVDEVLWYRSQMDKVEEALGHVERAIYENFTAPEVENEMVWE